ncbi:MAG: hypothetical protein MJB14_20600 [Spirochaetes bacterium]|nr:hypothetical protein [Spirochaetota bacterium]
MKVNKLFFYLVTFFALSFNLSTREIKVRLQNVRMLYNNHVGNEWSYEIKVNDVIVEWDIVASIQVEDLINIVITVIEMEKSPDIGITRKQISISELSDYLNKEIPLEVVVTEDRGRYSGNEAKWRFGLTLF